MDDYGRRVILDVPFELAVAETSQGLREEGFDAPELTLEALQHDPGIGPILPVTVGVYELADGAPAVVASPPLAPVLSDFGWRAATPALATTGDRASEQLAQVLDRLQRTAHHSPPVVQS